jgi:hypothetical protein
VVTETANITGANAYHVVTGSGTDTTAVLNGFTITAGHANGDDIGAQSGGGMFIERGSPILDNLLFSGNGAQQDGGGMHIAWSNPTLIDITFRSNRADAEGGGLHATWSSSPTLISVTFDSNRAGTGGGMYAWDSRAILGHVTFSGNQANKGGGMGSEGGRPSLDTVIFYDNQALWGGGLYTAEGASSLTNVVFYGNQAERGGGLLIQGGTPKLTNVIFGGNRANADGGGMTTWPEWYPGRPSNPELINVTFSGNQADRGGAMSNSKSNATLVNCILWGDSASTGTEVFVETGVVTATYSDIRWASGTYTGTGNINIDPHFVMPITATAAPTTAGNYQLLADSPAIDVGNNLSVTAATDLDGNP